MRVLRISHSAVVDAWRERERSLRSRGVEVRLLSAHAWDEGGHEVRLVPRQDEDVRGVRTVGRHPALFLYAPRPLWRALGEDWDLIDIHEEPYALATAEILLLRALRRLTGRRADAPPYLLYSAQNIEKSYPPPFRWLERLALRGAAAISVCNAEAGRISRAKGLRGRVELIPLGIDPSIFHPDPAGGPRVSDGRVRVGYAGRLAPHKGVETLLDAVAADDRLDLLLAGDGPSRQVLEERSATLDGRVAFLGPLQTGSLAELYRSLDVLAVPSRPMPGWVEQFGRVAVEAMACGTPVVATATGALPDVVGDVGLLVPPDDADALRTALLRAGTDRELAAGMRSRGLERASECTWQVVAERYQRMYQDAAGIDRRDDRAPGHPLEVVVVAYGRPDLVSGAVAPLVGTYPITVVDNSCDPRVREVAEAAGATYLDPGRNGGFAAGVNHALRHRHHPDGDVLLLNPDAVVTPRGVAELQRELRLRTGLASVGPRQADGDGRPTRVGWPFPSPLGTILESLGLGRLRRRQDFVIGSVLLLRGEAITDVGGFDEDFFLYAEETDWAYRARRRGWRHRVVPHVEATHLGAATSADSTERELHFHASQERYLRKHFGRSGWAVARAATVAGCAVRAAVLRGDRASGARNRLRLYLRGPLRSESLLAPPPERIEATPAMAGSA